MALHEHLRQIRTAAGFDQVGLARATGIDQATLSRLETGKRLPTVAQLQVLAKVLHTSMDALMGSVVTPTSPPCQPDRCPYLRELTTLMRESTERLVAAARHPQQEGQG